MTTYAETLTVRPLEPDDSPAVLALLGASLAGGPTGERTAAFFRWKHLANPFGPSPALVAEAAGRLVGLRAFLRWEFASGDRTVRAVRPVDTATHPDFQGRGIFRALTLRLLEELAGQVDVVYNTPNAQSLPGYLKMGWRQVGTVPVAVRPVRCGAFVRGARTAGQHAVAGPADPPRCPLPPAAEVISDGVRLGPLLAALAEADRSEVRLHSRPTLPHLSWRYAEAPGLDYRAVTVEHGGEIAGMAIGRPRRRGPLGEFTLSEVLVRPGDRGTARALLREVRRAGCDHVATHLSDGSALRSAGLRSGYFVAPRTGITLVARPLGDLDPDPCSPGSWRFSLGDLEVF